MLYNKLSKSQKIQLVNELLGINFAVVEAVRIDLMFKTVTLDSFRNLNDIITLKVNIESAKTRAITKNNIIDFYETIGNLPTKIDENEIKNEFTVLPPTPKPQPKHKLRVLE